MSPRRAAGLGPYLGLLIGIIGLGFSALFVKWANAPGPVSGFYRVAIAAAVLALPFSREVKREGMPKRPFLWMAALAGVFFAGDIAAWNTSILITSAANATLLANTSPLWVSLGALILFRERLKRGFWFALALILAGTSLILGQDYYTHPALGGGDLLALLAGFFYGGFFLATQRAREGASSLVSWWISAAASIVTLLAVSLLLGQPLTGYSTNTYLNLIALALITQVAAYLAINYALGHLPASIVSPTLLGQPVLTAVLAVPFLGQPLGPVQVLGGLVALVGIGLMHLRR
jgi:drug/metabolite transporter (DMT)-like permease